MTEKKLEMMYKVIKLMMVHFEEHQFEDGATSELFMSMGELDEIMTPYNATLEQVKALRDLTGDGMIRCNKAIIMARGDQELAVSLMQKGRV